VFYSYEIFTIFREYILYQPVKYKLENVTVGATIVVLRIPKKSIFDNDKIESGQCHRSQPKKATQVFVNARTCCTTTRTTESSKNILKI